MTSFKASTTGGTKRLNTRVVFASGAAALLAFASGCSTTSLERAPIESREDGYRTSPRPAQTRTTQPVQQTGQRPIIVDSNGNVINGTQSSYPNNSAPQPYQQPAPYNSTPAAVAQPIPVSPAPSTAPVVVNQTVDNQANAGQPGFYTVQAGDNIYRIGLNHNQSWQNIALWNGLNEPYTISIGQVLRVAPLPGDANTVVTETVTEVQTTIEPAPTPSTTTVTPATSGSSDWMWPAKGTIIGKFNGSSNKGINISGSRGTPVLASRSGSVVYSGSGLKGYGKLLIVKHDNTFLTAYAHNSKLLVKEGDSVRQGQKIAEMGDTDANRVMLHFEVRKDGKPVNPMGYLK